MQPLYSVDHESRHNSVRVEDTHEVQQPAETTPLLRFPPTPPQTNSVTTLTIGILLIILITGVVIGIYLLVLQDASENVLPPIDSPLQLVSRMQWDNSNQSQLVHKISPYKLKQVMIMQTNTRSCISTETCTKLLQEMQRNATVANDTIPYNFLISSNGQTYEALGWQHTSPLSTEKPFNGLVLAFIGDFSNAQPSRPQLEEAKKFFAESVRRQYLHPNYSIIGRDVNYTPTYLSQSFKQFPQWTNQFEANKTNST